MTDDDEVNIFASILAKDLGCKRSIAIVGNQNYRNLNKKLNLDVMINPGNITTSAILQYVRRGKVKEVHDFGDDRGRLWKLKYYQQQNLLIRKFLNYLFLRGSTWRNCQG